MVFGWYSFSIGVIAQKENTPLDRKVTFIAHSLSINAVLETIEKQTKLNFVYNSEIVADYYIVSLKIKDETVRYVLDFLFEDNEIAYQEFGNQVILSLPDKEKFVTSNNIVTLKDIELLAKKAAGIDKKSKIKPDTNEIFVDTNIQETDEPDSSCIYNSIHPKKLSRLKNNSIKSLKIKTIPIDQIMHNVKSESRRLNYSIDAFYSPVFTNSNISATNNDFNPFIDSIKKAEDYMISHSFGLQFSVNYKNGVLQTGLSYNHLLQDYDYNQSYEYKEFQYIENNYFLVDSYKIDIPAEDTVMWVHVHDSSIIVSSDSIFNITNEKVEYKNRNSTSYIEIPILIGYRYVVNSKINLDITGGILLGFYIGGNGKTIDVENKKEFIPLDQLPFIKPNISYIVKGTLSYNFYSNFSLLVSPYMKKNISSIMSDNYMYQKRYTRVGIDLGIRYTF